MSDAPEYASPSRRADLTGLPPAWVGVADHDILYEEGIAYAESLNSCGVPCEVVDVPGMYHGAEYYGSQTAYFTELTGAVTTL